MKYQTFLVKADNDREAVMRLPVDKHGGITTKGFKVVRERFSENDTPHGLRIAVNLEAFSNGRDLAESIRLYQKDQI